MGELSEAMAARKQNQERARADLESREQEAARQGALLAAEFIAEARRLGIEPDQKFEHETFYYLEHGGYRPTRSRGKDINRTELATGWSIYGYLLTTEGRHAVPTHQISEVRKRFLGKPYSIGEKGWDMRDVLASESVYTNNDFAVPLKDAMAEYLDRQTRK